MTAAVSRCFALRKEGRAVVALTSGAKRAADVIFMRIRPPPCTGQNPKIEKIGLWGQKNPHVGSPQTRALWVKKSIFLVVRCREMVIFGLDSCRGIAPVAETQSTPLLGFSPFQEAPPRHLSLQNVCWHPPKFLKVNWHPPKRDWRLQICSFCIELHRNLPSPICTLEGVHLHFGGWNCLGVALFVLKGGAPQKGNALPFPEPVPWKRSVETLEAAAARLQIDGLSLFVCSSSWVESTSLELRLATAYWHLSDSCCLLCRYHGSRDEAGNHQQGLAIVRHLHKNLGLSRSSDSSYPAP